MGMAPRFRDEFRWRNLALNFPSPESFYACQWCWPRPVFLVHKLVLAAYVVGWNIYSYVVLPSVGKHPAIVFLTQWAYLLLAIHLLLSFFIVLGHYKHANRKQHTPHVTNRTPRQTANQDAPSKNTLLNNQSKTGAANSQEIKHKSHRVSNGKVANGNATHYAPLKHQDTNVEHNVDIQLKELSKNETKDNNTEISPPKPLPCHLKLTWLLFNMSAGITPIVSMVYFFILYPYIKSENPEYNPGLLDINVHGINSLILLLDTCVSAIPVRIMHALYPALFGLLYTVFSAIYWAFDHENNALYPTILDWNYPAITSGVLLGLIVVALPLIQVLWYAVYRLKMKVYQRLYGRAYL